MRVHWPDMHICVRDRELHPRRYSRPPRKLVDAHLEVNSEIGAVVYDGGRRCGRPFFLVIVHPRLTPRRERYRVLRFRCTAQLYSFSLNMLGSVLLQD